jgi:O-antigen/teichoic acid export membrane protein
LATSAHTRPEIQLVRNSGLNLLGQGLPVLVAVATMPVLVRGLGPVQFGMLALAWTIVGYAGSFDLGLGRAATKRVSEAAWEGAAGRVPRLATMVVVAQGGLGLMTGAVLWLLAPLLGRILLPGTEPDLPVMLLRILAAAVPAVLLSNALRGVLEGLHRFELVNLGRAPTAAAMFLLPFAGVLLGWPLATIVASLVAARFAGAALYLVLYVRGVPGRAWGGLYREDLGALLRFGGWVAVSNTVIPLVVYLERFAVAALRGPAALAYYAAPHELVSKLHLVPAAVAGVLFPAFSGLSASGDRAGLVRRIRQGSRVVALLLAPPVAALILVASPLLSWWLGADYGAMSTTVLQLLAFALFLTGTAFVPFTLIEGVGRPDIVAKYHLFELPMYAAVLWFLVGRFGIIGAAGAWTLRMTVTAPLFYLIGLHAARIPVRAALNGSVARTLTASAGLLAVAGVLATLITNPLASIAAAILLTGAFIALSSRWLLEPDDRTALRRIGRRALPQADIEGLAIDG